MFGAKTKLKMSLIFVLILALYKSELSLQDLETQDVDSRKYKYEKLKEHFPNKFRPIPFK